MTRASILGNESNIKKYIVTDLINALPGNSSINTVQQAKKKRLGSVFYVRAEQR
jgi:hypothetical protein